MTDPNASAVAGLVESDACVRARHIRHQRCGDGDADVAFLGARGGWQELWQQQLREQRVSEVVDAGMHFVVVFRQAGRDTGDSGVQEQEVQTLALLVEAYGAALDALEGLEVQLQHPDPRVGVVCVDCFDDGSGVGRRASAEVDTGWAVIAKADRLIYTVRRMATTARLNFGSVGGGRMSFHAPGQAVSGASPSIRKMWQLSTMHLSKHCDIV